MQPGPPPPSRFTLLALGTPDALDPSGRRVEALVAQPHRLVFLTYLVHAGRPLTRTALLDLFWPDVPETRARNALSQALHFIGRALGGHVIHGRGTEVLTVSAGMVRYDVHSLEEVAHHPTRSALGLYRGVFLEGVSIAASNGLEDWIAGERIRMARLARNMAMTLAKSEEAAGRVASSMEAAARAVAITPLDESAQMLHIRLLAHTGHAADALREAMRFRIRLAHELEVHPSEEFERLVNQIRG
ncbi:MAG: hypothetical protein OEZ65_14410 [Gemmatimonadota bacterium]|nr:hypothetical protein [Gemmatimonadota bacterium]